MYAAAFMAEDDSYDAVWLDVAWVPKFAAQGWLRPLDDKLPPAAQSEYLDADIAASRYEGKIYRLPVQSDGGMLFYRKDLYEQKGWKAPRTLADMESQAKALHSPPGMYGIVYRGLKNANATPWAYMLFAMGGDYLTKDGKSAINTPEWAKTMDLYAGMLRQYGPPGVVNFNWYESSAAFMQGQVAAYMDGVNFASQFEDAAKSKVVGNVGVAQ